MGLSISGGISLGSYQAGVNYGLLEMYRHAAYDTVFRRRYRIPSYRLRAVTGASAGNINTLLWAIEACTDLRSADGTYRSPDPDSSLFWRVWLNIGWNRLFTMDSPELALLDRTVLIEGVAEPVLRERIQDPRLREGCEVPAGITLTRIEPDTLKLQGLGIVTQRHVTAFVVAVDSGGAPQGSRIRFRQVAGIADDDQHFGILVRLQPHDGDVPLDSLLAAVKASASFPIAFAPVTLDVYYPSRRKSETHAFADGGAFDNNPVGLARNLYQLEKDPRTLDILYVNPARYRGDLETGRHVEGDTTPTGGLAAVLALLQGAVPTARQYELQLLARERAARDEFDALVKKLVAFVPRERQDSAHRAAQEAGVAGQRERLRLSSRAYPVFGEHLGYFAGFLARPGREFDFYVGMYDALYMALWEHTCRDASDDRARRECVRRELPALISSPALVRDPGRQVLAWLYGREYGGTGAPALPQPTDAGMADRVTVQRAIFEAMGTRFAPPDRDRCADTRLVYTALCGDGLLEVLDTLRTKHAALAVLRRWSGECHTLCLAEPVFVDLIENPMAAATTVVDRVFARLRLVEGRMGTSDKSFEKPVAGAEWVFNASYLRSRPLFDLIPNSVPGDPWYRYVPPISYIGANLGTGGVEARLQPTWNVGNPTFLRANLIVHYNIEPLFSDERLYAGAGLSVNRYVSSVLVSEYGLGGNAFYPVGHDGELNMPFEVEGHVTLLANQVRVALRWLPDGNDRGLIHGRRGWAMSVGLSDPVGLLYGILR
ncbi:MAG TPA: patatin-like phospholipase family protein [Longimicrobium sp.]|nr:patatin-like phospholipase family protein [Longimicrobium sp.]